MAARYQHSAFSIQLLNKHRQHTLDFSGLVRKFFIVLCDSRFVQRGTGNGEPETLFSKQLIYWSVEGVEPGTGWILLRPFKPSFTIASESYSKIKLPE